MTGRLRLAAAVAATAALAGCSGTSPAEPDPVDTLIGPTWSLVTLNGQPVLSGTQVTAVFSTGERVNGKAGCNGYFGSVRLEPGRVAFGTLGATRMACFPEAIMDQEQRFFGALEAATHFSVRGEELRLGPSSATTTLVFRR